MKMTEKTKLQWCVPMTYHAEEARRELSAIFSPAAIGRIILATLAIFAMAAYLLPKWIPELEFDWVSALVKCMGVLVLILAVGSALSFIPPIVRLTTKGVLVTQGQSSTLYPFAELAELRIEEPGPRFPMLVLRLRSQQEAKRYPISPKIKLDDVRTWIDTYRPR
jgi:hypothetical protein